MKKKFLLTLLFASTPLFAQNIQYTKIEASSNAIAKYYGLTKEEVAKYQNYMDLEGRFRYPNADPINVLGMIADTEEDRYRYAKKAAAKEIEANRKLALFAQAFAAAGEKITGYVAKDTSIEKTYTLKSSDELIIIVDDQCGNLCQLDVTRALHTAKNTSLTVYKKTEGQAAIDLIKAAKSVAMENDNKVFVRTYDEFEFEVDKIQINRVMVKRDGRLLGLYQ